MWTRGPAMLQAPAASGPTKPFTISFDEVGTPATIPTDIGSFYAASNLITFGAGIYFADLVYTSVTIGTARPDSARSGAKFAHMFQASGDFSISFSAALQARKIEFYYQKGNGWDGSVMVYGSGGQSLSIALSTSGSVTSWTLLTFDADNAAIFNPVDWAGAYITSIVFTISTFGVMAVEDVKVY